MELTLDLSQFTLAQRQELLALIESFATPRYIPTADEHAEHDCVCGCIDPFYCYC